MSFIPFGFYRTPDESFDSDAQAFFTAVEGGGDTLTATEKTAVNDLVVQLKSDASWGSMYFLYPFVGGTASSCKWNLKNPVDTDAGYRITWQNPSNATFSAEGVKGDGSTFAGNTHFNPSTFGGNERHLSVYTNQASSVAGYDMGCNAPGVGNNNVIITNFNNNTSYAGFGNFQTANNTTGVGHIAGTWFNSGGSNPAKLYINGSKVAEGTSTPTDYNRPIAIFGDNRSGDTNGFSVVEESARRIATISLGEYFTDSGMSDFYDAIQTFNTTLGREV